MKQNIKFEGSCQSGVFLTCAKQCLNNVIHPSAILLVEQKKKFLSVLKRDKYKRILFYIDYKIYKKKYMYFTHWGFQRILTGYICVFVFGTSSLKSTNILDH